MYADGGYEYGLSMPLGTYIFQTLVCISEYKYAEYYNNIILVKMID